MTTTNETINVAVVGLGMGYGRARLCTQTPATRLVAVCDIDDGRGRKAAEEFSVPWITNYDELLERDEVDVVMIMTPSGIHGEQAVAAARAGKHVITTKPMEVTLEACDAMIQACEEAGVMLAVDFGLRYDPAFRRMARVVEAGLLGKLILVEARLKWFRGDEYYEGWHGTWRFDGGGALMNQTVHLVDVVCWLGGPVAEVNGRMGVFNHDIETEDTSVGLLVFRNGAYGVLVGTTTFPENRVFEFEIHGTKGGLAHGRAGGDYLKLLDASAVEPGAPQNEPKNIFEDVVGHLREGTPLACDGHEGRKSTELVLAIYQSALTGETVELPLKEFVPPKS